MISVVCVYNNKVVLEQVLLKSLRRQTAEYELITLDNTNGKFSSAAQALNHGGSQAKGDYIIFAHQDMWLASDTWLEDAERILSTLPDLGVAGVAGVSEKGKDWYERRKFSLNTLDGACPDRVPPVDRPETVQTLDECLLIVLRSVFAELKFDSKTFDGWDCYGADYCLSTAEMGLKSYVIPLPCTHSCSRGSGYRFWEFRDLLKYQKRLYRKHRRSYKTIYTWMERVSWSTLKGHELVQLLGPLFLRLFPDSEIRLQQELSDCRSVLDLGCGHHSPIGRFCIGYSVGVEMFEPSLNESRRKRIHNDYVRADVRNVHFKPKSFDAVIALQLLEHMTEEEGIALIGKMQEWAVKKIILTTPNGFLKQDPYDTNPLQEHRSGWDVIKLSALGFRVRGDGGWSRLRGNKGGVKYQPAFLWERISDMTQRVTYHLPGLAFHLMAVKSTGAFTRAQTSRQPDSETSTWGVEQKC